MRRSRRSSRRVPLRDHAKHRARCPDLRSSSSRRDSTGRRVEPGVARRIHGPRSTPRRRPRSGPTPRFRTSTTEPAARVLPGVVEEVRQDLIHAGRRRSSSSGPSLRLDAAWCPRGDRSPRRGAGETRRHRSGSRTSRTLPSANERDVREIADEAIHAHHAVADLRTDDVRSLREACASSTVACIERALSG